MTTNIDQTLLRFIEDVWNQGKLESIDDYLADQYHIVHDPGDPWDGQTLSRAAFKQRVAQSRAPIPDQTFDVQTVFTQDQQVCITWLWQGTHQGEISGFKPTGHTLTMSGATVYSFQDLRISGHWQIADRLSIYQQLMANSQT